MKLLNADTMDGMEVLLNPAHVLYFIRGRLSGYESDRIADKGEVVTAVFTNGSSLELDLDSDELAEIIKNLERLEV